MNNNILLAEIETELEKVKNFIDSGEINDVRRSRISAHGEELEDLFKQLKNKTTDGVEISNRFRDLKESLKTI